MQISWRVLLGACTIYFLGTGSVYYGLSVVLKPLIETMGWSRTAGTSGITVVVLTMGFGGPLIAWLIGRVDVRGTVIVGAICIALGALLGYHVTSLFEYYLALGILGFGNAAATFIPLSQLVARWFSARRSLAMGILLTAAGLGAFVITPFYALVLERTGDWRLLFAIMGCAAPLIALLALGLLRDAPSPDASPPLGAAPRTDAPGITASRVYQSAVDWGLGAALRSYPLWVIVAAIGLGLLGLNLVTSQAVLHLTDLGISQVVAGSAVGTVGLFSVFGRLGGGFFGDRFEPRYLAAVGLLCQAGALVILLFADQTAVVYLFTLLFGIGFGLGIVTAPILMANFYGAGSLARINGVTSVVTTGISAIGPTLAGLSSDSLGSYAPVFFTVAVLGVLLATVLGSLRPPSTSAAAAAARVG